MIAVSHLYYCVGKGWCKDTSPLQSAIANVGVALAEQPEPGGSAAALLLVIEPMWLGNVYNGQ